MRRSSVHGDGILLVKRLDIVIYAVIIFIINHHSIIACFDAGRLRSVAWILVVRGIIR